jgi:hypothetical protein
MPLEKFLAFFYDASYYRNPAFETRAPNKNRSAKPLFAISEVARKWGDEPRLSRETKASPVKIVTFLLRPLIWFLALCTVVILVRYFGR